ncbi:Farnesyl diphosphate synthase [Peptostreptococcus anaerobius]|uniref:Farnesyl diphosphate synthase n=1 Tax=Peptostreptococcus anaerobius TaxID=1261 RepID=A0A135YVX6_9FIRM|nr:farnesyl diphosphate synthase [Peptostreptococcus anaerobius]EKX95610.1 putative geranyltranstransferase [Peptostreptococcus anaerobius VPI 4330 = DSM 2949]KXI13517.1 putative geranyltranstransferase [Peptostreptococcus anaerobius]MDU0964491.1 polyprenyl synthetase family protein [Peptostreptococcus anaerobius]MDU0998391.1 polyprenyl synthetase family protein [Peptostreptococcus anaerobius]MDU5095827.1 polyprenyl synthetase family protein [Peptostreptococcus anaerobius]
MDFKKELKERSIYIEDKIESYLPKEEGYQKTIFEAMNYSLRAGGKRLRPILLMEAYKLCQGQGEDFVPYSVAMEMIHTYSLIHDDLPALDNDDLRRGKPTNHIVFGEAMAILAGDALLNTAYETMLNATFKHPRPELSLRAAYEISRGAGIYGMIGGQVVDVESEDKKINKDKLDYIHMNKTAAMIVGSVRAGAILAGIDEDRLESLTKYAENIGLAFQIVDDILDIEGDEKLLGKRVGSDLDNDKSTYPSLLGISESKKIVENLIEEAKISLEVFDSDAEFMNALADFIRDRQN